MIIDLWSERSVPTSVFHLVLHSAIRYFDTLRRRCPRRRPSSWRHSSMRSMMSSTASKMSTASPTRRPSPWRRGPCKELIQRFMIDHTRSVGFSVLVTFDFDFPFPLSSISGHPVNRLNPSKITGCRILTYRYNRDHPGFNTGFVSQTFIDMDLSSSNFSRRYSWQGIQRLNRTAI